MGFSNPWGAMKACFASPKHRSRPASRPRLALEQLERRNRLSVTAGWDYGGFHFVPPIALLWNHGRKYQGGVGSYKADGPNFIEEHKEKKGE